MRFRLAPTSVTLDDLEGRKLPLAKVNKNSDAHQKNFNEDRPILSAAKCRPVDLCCRNIKYMCLFAGVPSETGVMKDISHLYTCVHVLVDSRKRVLSSDVGRFPSPALPTSYKCYL